MIRAVLMELVLRSKRLKDKYVHKNRKIIIRLMLKHLFSISERNRFYFFCGET